MDADEEWEKFVQYYRATTLKDLAEASFVMTLVPRRGDLDVKFAVELGAAIMLDKTIVALATPGRPLPRKLLLVVDRVIVADIETEEGQAEFSRVMAELIAEDEAKEDD